MKATIYQRISGDRLPHLVPPAYRDALPELARPDGEYSLLLFAHAERDVVPSLPVRKALRGLGPPAPDGIVAVGAVFTAEALELLHGSGAQVVALHKSFWTDQSARERQL